MAGFLHGQGSRAPAQEAMSAPSSQGINLTEAPAEHVEHRPESGAGARPPGFNATSRGTCSGTLAGH